MGWQGLDLMQMSKKIHQMNPLNENQILCYHCQSLRCCLKKDTCSLCDIPSGCCFFTGPWTVGHSFAYSVGSLISVGRCGRCCSSTRCLGHPPHTRPTPWVAHAQGVFLVGYG